MEVGDAALAVPGHFAAQAVPDIRELADPGFALQIRPHLLDLGLILRRVEGEYIIHPHQEI